MNHGQHVRDRNEDILACLGVGPKSNSRCSDERTNVVRLLNPILGMPRDIVLVSEVSRKDGSPVVSSETNEQEPSVSEGREFVLTRHGQLWTWCRTRICFPSW